MKLKQISANLSKGSINYCSNDLAKADHHLKGLLKVTPGKMWQFDLERGTQEAPQLNRAGFCHVDRDAHARHSDSHPNHNPAYQQHLHKSLQN